MLLPQIPSAPEHVNHKRITPTTLAWLDVTLKEACPEKQGGVTERTFTSFGFGSLGSGSGVLKDVLSPGLSLLPE